LVFVRRLLIRKRTKIRATTIKQRRCLPTTAAGSCYISAIGKQQLQIAWCSERHYKWPLNGATYFAHLGHRDKTM